MSYQGDEPRYAAWTSSFTGYVMAHAIQPRVTLQVNRSTYDAGTAADLHVDLADSSSHQVTVVATSNGAAPAIIFSGTVPDDGLTLHPDVTANETITATTPADDTHTAAQASVAVNARLVLQTLASHPEAMKGSTAIFGPGSSPLFRSHLVAPRRNDLDLRFEVQLRTYAGWHTIITSAPLPLGPARWVRWHFTKPHHTGIPYRVRTTFSGDATNVASHSPWVNFRFSRS